LNDAGILSAVFVAVLAAFYIMFLRPIQKDQAKHRQQIRDLRAGDRVLTTSGFIAKVKDIQVQESGPTQIALELADGVIFTAVTTAIAQRLTPEDEHAPSKGSRHDESPSAAGPSPSKGTRNVESPSETGRSPSTRSGRSDDGKSVTS
jgi:preprotein translocase subunit YajC